MKINNIQFHQGDTQWFGLDELPEGVKKTEKQFVAASERSGSFHALMGDYEMYECGEGFVVDVKNECILNHSLRSELEKVGVTLNSPDVLSKKDHPHTVVAPGIYYVGIQQRFDPLSGIKQKVRD